MSGATRQNAGQNAGQNGGQHEGFLRHRRFYWLKAGLALAGFALVVYAAASVPAGPYGGTWAGYGLGTIGALLIVWLALLGIRKRRMSPGKWSLKAWTSAHVYLGLALVVVATVHTGFHFGWNLHTLAYGLMLLVIASGLFGVVAYAALPTALGDAREELTQPEMVEGLRAIDRLLHEAAQPLPTAAAALVSAAMAQSPFDQGLASRLSGRHRACATQAALDGLAASGLDGALLGPVERLLIRRKGQLERVQRQLRLRALLEVWLYVHVPATIALLAALAAHIFSVFYYW